MRMVFTTMMAGTEPSFYGRSVFTIGAVRTLFADVWGDEHTEQTEYSRASVGEHLRRERSSRSDSRSGRTILVAVVGESPAVVTETLWALAREKGESVDEVRVITTSRGKRTIVGTLLDNGRVRFDGCCRECGLNPEQVKFGEDTIEVLTDGVSELADIRNSRENQLAADRICELIRGWTAEPGTRLHCSAAGGRKTMGIYLTMAMMLYGRAEDRLWHVLVEPEDFERCKDFLHPYRKPRRLAVRDKAGKVIRQLSTADVRLDLAEIPFVRLRELDPAEVAQGTRSYSQIVGEAQGRLRFLSEAVSVTIQRAQGSYKRIPFVTAGHTCQLTTASGFVYALLALHRRKEGGKVGLAVGEITSTDLRRVYQLLTGEGYTDRLEGTDFDFVVQWGRQIERREMLKGERRRMTADERKKIARDFDNFKGAIERAVNRANVALKRGKFPERFMIVNLNRTKKRQAARYALQLTPQMIRLPE